MPNLRCPFFGDVFETVWTVDGETHEDHVSVWVGERPESVVVLLTWRVRGMMREGGEEGEGEWSKDGGQEREWGGDEGRRRGRESKDGGGGG